MLLAELCVLGAAPGRAAGPSALCESVAAREAAVGPGVGGLRHLENKPELSPASQRNLSPAKLS